MEGVRMGSPEGKNGRIHFGPFELDPDEQQLRKRGIPVKLQPQQFAVLWMLTQRAGQIVSRDEIHQHIWGTDTFVDFERGINFAINQIRAALGDHAEQPRFIETIPRRGYRFMAAIENVEPGDSNSAIPLAQIENGEPALVAASVTPISGDRKSTASADQEEVSASSDVGPPLPARPQFATKILVALALPAILSAGFLGYHALSGRARRTAKTPTRSAFSNMRITPLTSHPGIYWDPAFSPDGKQIAFFWNDPNPARGDLYVQLVGGEKALRITHTNTGFVCCADWSPDGQQIVFARCDDSGGGVFSVPALGGSERKLTDVACLPFGVGISGESADVRWTADGKSLVLTDRCTPDAPRGIVVFSLQTGEKSCLHSPPVGDSGDNDVALSPDEKTVAFLRWPTSGLAEIYTVAFSGGNLRQLTDEFFDQDTLTLMWSANGKYITFEPARDRMARVAASGGPVEFEAVYPKIGSLSRDYRRLAYIEPELVWRWSPAVWRINLANAGGRVVSEARILLSATGGDDSAQLSPDEHQLVFASRRSGTHQLWKSNVDGSDPLQLTSFDHGYPGTPRWSPDGKWTAFDFHARAHSQIYLVDSEGRNLHALTSGNSEDCVPSWSRNGRAVYFASDRTGNWQVWRRELSSGNETQVTRHGGFAAFESYDAKTIYYSKFDGGGIWKIPVGGGREDRVTDSLHLGYWGHFAVTDKGLYLVDSDAKGGPAIMYYNFKTGRLSLVLTFKQYPTPWFPNLAASRDGRMLFYAPVEFQSTMISMVENFQ
jgi:Tol biopolymer transport system component/DNA-binding winged helix-turn-helix (wHTH) protein